MKHYRYEKIKQDRPKTKRSKTQDEMEAYIFFLEDKIVTLEKQLKQHGTSFWTADTKYSSVEYAKAALWGTHSVICGVS